MKKYLEHYLTDNNTKHIFTTKFSFCSEAKKGL